MSPTPAPITLIVRTISRWPWPAKSWSEQKRSQFKAHWTDTDQLLRREIGYLGDAQQAVLEVDVSARDIRADGFIRADARPRSPRVALYFTHRVHGPLQYHCDNYETWPDNVRAIALALEALRAVDRYGVTSKGEQYTGWKALPASTELTPTEAAKLIAGYDPNTQNATELLRDFDVARRAALRAMQTTHPDKGGTADLFQRIQAARTILFAHHGRSV